MRTIPARRVSRGWRAPQPTRKVPAPAPITSPITFATILTTIVSILTIIVSVGVPVYLLGLLAIERTLEQVTKDAFISWYATSLVPVQTVEMQGAQALIGPPTLILTLIYGAFVLFGIWPAFMFSLFAKQEDKRRNETIDFEDDVFLSILLTIIIFFGLFIFFISLAHLSWINSAWGAVIYGSAYIILLIFYRTKIINPSRMEPFYIWISLILGSIFQSFQSKGSWSPNIIFAFICSAILISSRPIFERYFLKNHRSLYNRSRSIVIYVWKRLSIVISYIAALLFPALFVLGSTIHITSLSWIFRILISVAISACSIIVLRTLRGRFYRKRWTLFSVGFSVYLIAFLLVYIVPPKKPLPFASFLLKSSHGSEHLKGELITQSNGYWYILHNRQVLVVSDADIRNDQPVTITAP